MNVLFEDRDLIVAVKPPEAASEQTPDGNGFADLLAAGNGGYIGVVHRLDRGVGGVMVYAKTKSAAASLSASVAAHRFEKEYVALVHGTPAEPAGRLRDLLFHDRLRNKTFVVDRERAGVKEALADYETVAGFDGFTLVRVRLITGRTHQIRVQFASRGMPLVGDGKYGAHDSTGIALFCQRLTFPHPVTGVQMTFTEEVPEWFFTYPKTGN